MNTSLAFEIILKTVTLLFAIGLLGFGVMLLEHVDYVGRFIDTINHKKNIVARGGNKGYNDFIVTFECLCERLFYYNNHSMGYADRGINQFAHEYIVDSQKIVKTSVSVKPTVFNVTLNSFGTRVDSVPDISKHMKPPMEDDVDTIIKRRFGFV